MNETDNTLEEDIREFLSLVILPEANPLLAVREGGEHVERYHRTVSLRGSFLKTLEDSKPAETLDPDSPFFTVLLPFFLNRAEKETYPAYLDSLLSSENVVVAALEHPSCPPALLSRACHSMNLHYAYIASRAPACLPEDAVYAQLRFNGEPDDLSDYLSRLFQ